MKGALLLGLGLLCGLAAAAPVITSADNEQFHSLRPDTTASLQHSPCDYCQDLMKTVDDFVNDPESQKAVAEYIQASVCPSLPQEWRAMCEQEVPVLVAQGAQIVAQLLQPGEALANTPFDCPMCRMVVVSFIARLQDKEARTDIERDMRAACNSLPPAGKARCLQDVADLFGALDRLLHDVDAEGVCEVFDFCSEGDRPPRSPEPARALAAALRQLATGAPAAAGAAPANDMCQNCKTIVMEAAAILQDPKTQAELLDYAKQGCAMFQAYKDQCEAYVTLYGPLVLNMVLSYLQPDSLCTRLGYCPAQPPLLASV